MTNGLATVSTAVLRQRVNKRLRTKHSLTYMSRVKNGHAGSASLQDVTRQEAASILEEAAAALRRPVSRSTSPK